MTPSRRRAITGGVWARKRARWSPGRRRPHDGIVAPGADPAPGSASVGVASAPVAAAIASARDRSSSRGVAAIRQNGTVGHDVAAEVGEGDVLQGGEHEAARTQGAGQRVAGAAGDEVGAPGDDPGLRAAEQLVAAERDERGAGLDGLAGGRLGGQPGRRVRAGPPRARDVEEAAAEVDDDGRAERRQLGDRGVLDEAVDAVVARVHLEHEGDVGPGTVDGPAVVGEPGAVGRADVDEPGAGLLHHLGDAEPTADLDALAPADRHVPSGGERGEHEQHRGGVVVDDDGVLGAAQPGEQLADGALARAALAGRQVELDATAPGPPGGGRAAPGRGWCAAARRWR